MLTADQWELIRNIAAAFGILTAFVVIASACVKVIGSSLPSVLRWRNRRTLRHRLGAELYDVGEIKRATEYYIPPDCQSVDPSGSEDFRRVVSTREPLFETADRLFGNPSEHKFILVLADSGMGKTSFFLNYYAPLEILEAPRKV